MIHFEKSFRKFGIEFTTSIATTSTIAFRPSQLETMKVDGIFYVHFFRNLGWSRQHRLIEKDYFCGSALKALFRVFKLKWVKWIFQHFQSILCICCPGRIAVSSKRHLTSLEEPQCNKTWKPKYKIELRTQKKDELCPNLNSRGTVQGSGFVFWSETSPITGYISSMCGRSVCQWKYRSRK